MRVEEIHHHARGTPFRPFRLYVSDGNVYEVTDADHVLVTRLTILIGVEPNESGIPRRGVYLDPVHVTRIEPIVNAEPPPSNGEP